MGVILEDITPNAGSFCKSQRHIGYNFYEAVCDLIDNSISAQSSKIELFIDYENKEYPFLIRDNGSGMNEKELVNAFIMGRIENLDSEHGKFGFGLKTASISQARILEVHSKSNGQINSRKMDLNYFDRSGQWNLLEADPIQFIDEFLKNLDSGTAVLWRDWDFYKEDSVNVDRLIKHVGVIYNKLISSNLSIWINEIEVEPISVIPDETKSLDSKDEDTFSFEIFLIKHPKYWDKDYNQLNQFNSYKLFGTDHMENQGVYIYRNNRLISIVPEWYDLISKKSRKFSLARVEFFYWDKNEDFGLDIRHSKVTLPSKVKTVFREYSKVIKMNALKKIIDGKKQTQFVLRNDNIWNMMVQRDGEVSFEINIENRFINHVLLNGDRGTIILMLKKIAKEIPIGDILSRQEKYFIDEKLSYEDHDNLRNIYRQLYPDYTEEQIMELLL